MYPLILFHKVTKSIKGKDIIRDISFQIEKGDLFGLIGPSGAGKTTLLKLLVGYYGVDSGMIYIDGKALYSNDEIKKKIGFTSQDNAIYEELSVFDNIKYFGKIYDIPFEVVCKRADELLELMDMGNTKDKLVKDLSGGMKRRIDIICALIHDPDIIILDEPSAGLDPIQKKHIINLIVKINELGKTIVLSTHLLDNLDYICKKIAILADGQILSLSTPTELKNVHANNSEIKIETYPGNYNQIKDNLSKMDLPISEIIDKKYKLIVYTKEPEYVLKNILELVDQMEENLVDVNVDKPSLSEAFNLLVQRYEKNV